MIRFNYSLVAGCCRAALLVVALERMFFSSNCSESGLCGTHASNFATVNALSFNMDLLSTLSAFFYRLYKYASKQINHD